jgi:hypothetical protein
MEIHSQAIFSEAGTSEEARKLLANLSEKGFSGKIGELAGKLERGPDEILDILNYDEEVDEDLFTKIHRIAREFDLLAE